MEEIKCPKCGTVFSVDENEYASLVEQVRNKEFNAALEKEVERMEETAKKNETIALMKADAEKNKAIAEKDEVIARLKAELEGKDENTALQIEKAIADKDKKIFELKTAMQSDKEKHKNEIDMLVAQHKKDLDAKDETIDYYKDYKAKLSTKMVGESLEQHCESKFNEIRALAFPNAYFDKDNDAKSGSKGDYVYREFAEDGKTEILSIMFEMKNETDSGSKKHKNEQFFAELDKDRKEKKCEYAILVSMLEPDSELYNVGIVDVSYKYEKMYVIRPQFFITVISLLRNAAMNSLKYKQDLELARQQEIDVTNFQSKVDEIKNKFAKSVVSADKCFEDAIDKIDKVIDYLEKTKEDLRKTIKHLGAAENKLDALSVKKLTRGNGTMKALFASAQEAQDEEDDVIIGQVEKTVENIDDEEE